MDIRTSGKIASIALFVLGFIEVSGAVMLFILPHDVIKSMGIHLPWELTFAAALSVIFGSSRLVAGYAVWLMRKWGFVLGIVLSIITLTVAPLVYRVGATGIKDVLLAIIALTFLLYSWFGNEVIVVDEKGSRNQRAPPR